MSSDRNVSDASRLSEIGKGNLETLYDYAIGRLDRVQVTFTALDSKASQTVGLVAVVGGILVFALSRPNENRSAFEMLLFISAVCFILTTLCCLLCLLVRSTLEPPTIEQAVNWVCKREKKTTDIDMLSALTIDLVNAEYSHWNVCRIKARYLTIGQAFEVVGIISLLLFVIIANIQF